MYAADAKHPDKTLEEKLFALYDLKGGPTIDLTIRQPYLDLLHRLGDPHKKLPPVIHVAGTNGKGSTIATMRAILEAAGYRVHAYTSPHLIKFNERIVLAGRQIDDNALETLLDEVVAVNNGGEVTFFEITTAMAFLAFSRVQVDILLLETGLGGRLDCTNVVENPAAVVITPISFDHMEFLGDTLEKIAKEKAGIIKAGSNCIIAPQDPLARSVLKSCIEKRKCNGFIHSEGWSFEARDTKMILQMGSHEFMWPEPSLTGKHQIMNAMTAICCLKTLKDFKITNNAIEKGLRQINWPGRLQRIERGSLYETLPDGAELWYDGGHNEAAGKALAEQARIWQKQDGKPLHLILGMMKTKDPIAFVEPLLPYVEDITCISIPDEPMGYEAEILYKKLLMSNLPIRNIDHSCLSKLSGNILKHTNSRIILCGSLYFAKFIWHMYK